jgi:hypothetical protein
MPFHLTLANLHNLCVHTVVAHIETEDDLLDQLPLADLARNDIDGEVYPYTAVSPQVNVTASCLRSCSVEYPQGVDIASRRALALPIAAVSLLYPPAFGCAREPNIGDMCWRVFKRTLTKSSSDPVRKTRGRFPVS